MKSRNLISFLITISLSLQGFASEDLTPARGFLTEIALKSSPKTLVHLNNGIKNPGTIAWKSSDKELTQKVLTELKKQKATITYGDRFFTVKVAGKEMKITLVDLISQTYSINGHYYQFTKDKSLRGHIDSIVKIVKKKVVYSNPLIEEAHAFIPLIFAIPAIIAGSAAAITIDGIASGVANDMKNMDQESQKKINELTEKYKDRANACESDLENAKASSSKGQTIELKSVRAIGELHKVLNTELYNKWFNGKSQIDYDNLGCGKIAKKHQLASGSFTGIFSGSGQILGKLCLEQDRLNQCFSSTEDIMRDQGIQINELAGPDRLGPFKGIYEEYKEFNNSRSK